MPGVSSDKPNIFISGGKKRKQIKRCSLKKLVCEILKLLNRDNMFIEEMLQDKDQLLLLFTFRRVACKKGDC